MIPLALFLLACASVYLGLIEAAFGATLRLPLRLLAERDGDSRLQKYLDDPVRLYVASRVMLSVISILVTIGFAAMWQAQTWRALGAVLATGVAFIVVCQQLLPLLLIRHDPERALELLLPPFDIAARLFRPLSEPLTRVGARRERRATQGGIGEEMPASDVDAAGVGEDDEAPGLIEGDERQLLRSIVDFGDTLVKEVMTPRPDVVAIASIATLDELRALVREEQYSRIPVFGEGLDEIVGIVFVKDLIRLWGAENTDGAPPTAGELMRPATFVPETKRVVELLREFQVDQAQMAIVVDEYGGTAGLVTLEDLIEEIVGEIRDEHDDEEADPIVEEGNGVYVMSGMVDVDEMASRLGVRIDREGFETVGGYLLACLGRVPAAGESVEVDGLAIDVLQAEGRRVLKVRLRRLAAEPNTTASAS
jgi:CBS domain containing-hemolysin-like protein